MKQIHGRELNPGLPRDRRKSSISGLVLEYIVTNDVARIRFPADALS
jgi:hypothetical protein